MTTEQIDLKIVKKLIDGAKNLKDQLNLSKEQLRKVMQERDVLSQEVQNQKADFVRKQEAAQMQHNNTIQSLQNEARQKLEEIKQNSQDELKDTIKQYEDQLNSATSSYEEKLKTVTDELTQKNANLLKELQKTQKSYQAVINRIRGLS